MSTVLPAQDVGGDVTHAPLWQGEFIDLRELLRTLNRYKWGVLSIALVVLLLTTLVVYAMTPIYRASVTLLIETRSNRPVQEVQEVYDPGYGSFEYLYTQYEILRSRDLADKVAQRLGLSTYAEFALPQNSLMERMNWRRWLPFLPSSGPGKLSQQELEGKKLKHAVKTLSKRVKVEAVPGTQLVKVHVDSEDPKRAALIANTLADAFIDSSLDARLTMSRKANSWLTERLKGVRADLSKAEQALQTFREQEKIVNLGGSRGFVEQELTDNAMRLREARKRKAELASAYWKIEQAGGDPKSLEAASTQLTGAVEQDAKNRMAEAAQKVKPLESRYGPKHPAMIAARAALDEATAAYHRQLQTAAQGVKAEYEVARETERQLSQIEQGARGQIQSLDRKEYEISTLERDVETNRELYNLFLTRFKETDPTGGGDYQAFNARVVDPAIVPDKPFKPNKPKFLLLAAIGGLFLGLLAAVLRYLLSDTIDSSQELEQLTGLPILGVLPVLESIKPGKISTVLDQPKSSFSEGMRSIRTGLVLSDLDQKKKRLIVTSSAPQEGKTTVALNLAVTLGQMERVLVIDCDLRRPMLGKLIGLTSAKPGLTELLSELVKPENCIHRYEAGNIDVLPVGKLPPNPGEILASQRFRKLIEVLSARYDRIVFDSAPCQAVSDTLLLAQNADAVLFVVKSEKTTRGLVRHSIRQLRHARAPLIGAVVNYVDLERHARYYDSYYYAYRYYE